MTTSLPTLLLAYACAPHVPLSLLSAVPTDVPVLSLLMSMCMSKMALRAGRWWHMSLIPALREAQSGGSL